jgi:tetratricopeptide (TPR) repeat protein
LATQSASADVAAELSDLSARVEYGFYAEEPRVIDAAEAALERLDADDPAVRYQRALAAYRSAQLMARDNKNFSKTLDRCFELSPTEGAADDAEPWILVAACASLGVERGLSQQRRRDEALNRALAIDEDNPRIAFLEASLLANGLPADATDVAVALTRAEEAFRSWDGGYVGPTWGEAETLVLLGEVHLERGEARAARDLLERALLIAPDYRAALNLRARLQRAAP